VSAMLCATCIYAPCLMFADVIRPHAPQSCGSVHDAEPQSYRGPLWTTLTAYLRGHFIMRFYIFHIKQTREAIVMLLSDNVAPTSLATTHLFLHLLPHLPLSTHHPHHLSLIRCFTPGLKPSCSTNPFHPRLPFPSSGLTPCFYRSNDPTNSVTALKDDGS